MPEISVLMSTVTVDPWLTEAAQSILDQRDVDIELVLVLDGAEAETEPAWMRDGRVRIIQHARRTGLANALDVAAQASRGAYLARMDADDISAADRLWKSQQYLESNADVAVVGTSASLIDGGGRVIGESGTEAADDVRHALVLKNQLVHSSVMMRRDAYECAGGYNSRLLQMEDYDLWLRMATVGRVANLPDKLLLYRLHAQQMSRRAMPYGPHVRAISRGQYQLGRKLGMRQGRIGVAILAWRAAQFARYYGLTRPGYDAAARSASAPGGNQVSQ